MSFPFKIIYIIYKLYILYNYIYTIPSQKYIFNTIKYVMISLYGKI